MGLPPGRNAFKLVDAKGACKIVPVSIETMQNAAWRRKHKVPIVKIGTRVFYDIIALWYWAEQRRQNGVDAEPAAEKVP